MSPLQRVRLEQRGFTGMTETLSGDVDEEHRAFYLENMFPFDPSRPSELIPRRGLLHFPTTGGVIAAGQGQLVYQLTKVSGTTYTVAVIAGQIYTYNATADTWSVVVTTANFTSKSITRTTTGRWYAATYNDTLVVNDGTNQPWTWDGTTGAGGLTKLTNAPSVVYGVPAVYYGKLFFIKSDRATLAWSEENSANVGYEAGGYNNTWTLSQTYSSPLTALIGTNLGLYYFREHSIGVIVGSVTPDFQTTGVHDAVATEMGCRAPEGITLYGNVLYFFDDVGRPMAVQVGGGLIELWKDMERRVMPKIQATYDPYASYEDTSGGHTNPGTTSFAYMTVMYAAQWNAMVFFYSATGLFGAVYSVKTNRLMGYLTSPTDTATALGRVGVFISSTGKVVDTIMVLDGSGNAAIFRAGSYYSAGNYYRDDLTDNTRQYSTRFIGRRMVHDPVVGLHFDRLSLEVRVNGTGAGFAVQLATSERWNTDDLSTAQTYTTASGDTRQPRRITVGLNQYGRWAAPIVNVTSASTIEARVFGYSLDAFVDADDAALV